MRILSWHYFMIVVCMIKDWHNINHSWSISVKNYYHVLRPVNFNYQLGVAAISPIKFWNVQKSKKKHLILHTVALNEVVNHHITLLKLLVDFNLQFNFINLSHLSLVNKYLFLMEWVRELFIIWYYIRFDDFNQYIQQHKFFRKQVLSVYMMRKKNFMRCVPGLCKLTDSYSSDVMTCRHPSLVVVKNSSRWQVCLKRIASINFNSKKVFTSNY